MKTVKPKRGNVVFNTKERWIMLFGRISKDTAMQFARFIVETQEVTDDWSKPISVFINSIGGDSMATNLIYYMLANLPSSVITIIVKKANSGAFIISQAGSRRMMKAGATLRFHWAVYHFNKDEVYDVEELDFLSDDAKRINEQLFRIVAEKSGLGRERIKEFFRQNRTLTADQAKEYNLIDEIYKKLEKGKLPRRNKDRKKKNANKRRNGK